MELTRERRRDSGSIVSIPVDEVYSVFGIIENVFDLADQIV